jgi:hypothetical protein
VITRDLISVGIIIVAIHNPINYTSFSHRDWFWEEMGSYDKK